ncbi:MAG TPA: molybdopterin-dependent oxidoreductase [Mucilaginibacter sp.]|nr:molybdopterin-dependent oxidoreductase [Mucilaginibacter sp.]
MKKYIIAVIVLTGFLLNVSLSAAQAQPRALVKITGMITKPLSFTVSDLNKFKQTRVSYKSKDGKSHIYSGVLLAELLQKAGAAMGKALRGGNLNKYVQISASDNYKVVFALAELDNEFTDRLIILATSVDGKSLPAKEGPFRVIVEGEKKPARCIRMVTVIKVESAK